MIARRRWKMGGTRYNARGIDQEGNVANHTETEQLVFIHRRHNPPLLTDDPNYTVLATTKVYSYVQVRGSIPIFWDQSGVATVTVNPHQDLSEQAMLRHYQSLKEDYDGKIVTLNLIGESRGIERPIADMQNRVMNSIELHKHDVSYFHFDFHHECKESSEPMLNYLKEVILSEFLDEIKIFH